MNKIALARKYRPRNFQTLVGQDVTVQALKNALDNQRLHHAYLFTGTRGVGKTTIARILAKCLNCEKGISSTPCGQCSTCSAIDEGRFVDLIEVDAASRTKVEDTRELLENVQYLPTIGRFKVYLIDEVHMLSGHSFNALLKTLEEPPVHVKFLLATTDPQKLPITVLSRCLQFHLRHLPVDKIVNYLTSVLQQEGVTFELEALQEISRAADGSLRDALSLLDQTLSFGNGHVEAQSVRSLLGVSERGCLLVLLAAVAKGDTREVLHIIKNLAESTADFSGILSELLVVIHQLAIAQSCQESLDDNIREKTELLDLVRQVSPQEIQLYYQIGLQGQRDLPFAPNPKIGFEMILLRMIAFQPVSITTNSQVQSQIPNKALESKEAQKQIPNVVMQETTQQIVYKDKEEVISPVAESEILPPWNIIVDKLNLTGLSKAFAENCVLASYTPDVIQLVLEESQKLLLTKRHEERLREALCQYTGKDLRLVITVGKVSGETPSAEGRRRITEAHQTTRKMIESDPNIQQLIQTFDATVERVTNKE